MANIPVPQQIMLDPSIQVSPAFRTFLELLARAAGGGDDLPDTGLADHLNDPADAHDASAVSVVPAGTISSTNVQSALQELDTEKATYTYVDTQDAAVRAYSDAADAAQNTSINNRVLRAGDTMTGRLDSYWNPGQPITSAAGVAAGQIGLTNPAVNGFVGLTLHSSGAVAYNLGIQPTIDANLRIGGWSYAGSSYKVWTENMSYAWEYDGAIGGPINSDGAHITVGNIQAGDYIRGTAWFESSAVVDGGFAGYSVYGHGRVMAGELPTWLFPRFHARNSNASWGWPNVSGNTDPAVLTRFDVGNITMDFGSVNPGGVCTTWIQARDSSRHDLQYKLALNPNGGGVGINTQAPPAGGLTIGGGHGITAGDIYANRNTTDGVFFMGSNGDRYLYMNANRFYFGLGYSVAAHGWMGLNAGNVNPIAPFCVTTSTDNVVSVADSAGLPCVGVLSANGSAWKDLFLFSALSVKPLTDNAMSMGSSTRRWTSVWAVTGAIQTSDARAKTEVADSDLGLAFVESLRPVSYKWIVGKNKTSRSPDYEIDIPATTEIDGTPVPASKQVIYKDDPPTPVPGQRTHYGLIAQEVATSVQAAGVVDFGGYVDARMEEGASPDVELGLRYDEFIAPMIKAIQELSAQVKALQAQVGGS